MSDKNASLVNRFLRPRATVNRMENGRIQVVLEMPGVAKDGLEVKVENNELTVTGRREQPRKEKAILRERPQGDYLISYTLDETVDAGKVDALLEKGLLTLTLELKEHVKPRSIPVRAG
jgi:HSP20 family protein